MKKNLKIIFPVVSGVFLLLVSVVVFLIQKNMPNKKKMSLFQYFGVEGNTEKAILIVEDEITDVDCLIRDQQVYVAFDYVKEHFNSRFYWDKNENLLLYTTPTTEISVVPGEKDCLIGRSKESKDYVPAISEGGQIYVAADYIKEYTALQYQVYKKPNRVVLTNEFNVEKEYVKTTEECAIRNEQDIKSLVLKNEKEGAKLRLLNKENKETGFCQVMEESGIIGYVKAKSLDKMFKEKVTTEFKSEKYTHILREDKVSMVWHQVMSQVANSTLSDVLATAKGVNVICPTWFKAADNEGGIDSSVASYDYVAKAHQAGIEVWGMCDDQSPDMKIGTVLESTTTRRKLVNNLVAKAIQYDLDGINIDFEYIKKESGEDFVQFIRELGIKCRTNSLVLSIDNYPLMDYNEYYDRKEQANVADYVVVMAYDEFHKNSEEAGPVSSLSYVKDSITSVLTEVPKEQVIIGLPFYSRYWKEKTKNGKVELSVESCSMNYTKQIVEKSGKQPVWDDQTGQNYLEFEAQGIVHKMWIEDRDSLDLKLQEVAGAKVAGFSFWKYGLESKEVWNMVRKYAK